MPVLIKLQNCPPKATICQIFSLLSDLNYEPEEVTLLDRRRDIVFFEMTRVDHAYRAVMLSGRMMLSHSVIIAHSNAKELEKFRDDNKNVPVDNSCYTPLPSPLSCSPSFFGANLLDYNEQILKRLNLSINMDSLSPIQQVDIKRADEHSTTREYDDDQNQVNPHFSSILRVNSNVNQYTAKTAGPSRVKEQSNSNTTSFGKRKKPESFVMYGFEPTSHRQKTAPHLINTGAYRETAIGQIELNYSVSATKCFLRWKLPQELRIHHQELEVETNFTEVSRARLGLVSDYCILTVPGQVYNVEIFLFDAIGNVVAVGQCSFKAIFSLDEMRNLYNMALQFAGDMLHPYKSLYRCKPKRYYDRIYHVDGRIMKPYLKDSNGQAAGPINGVLHGLFFSARLQNNGQLPLSSPFGEVRMQIPVEKLLDSEKVNMYFSDFYCNKKLHYVTLVICKKGSDSDRFCRDRLILLSPTNNNFLKEVKGQHGKSFCVNLKVWVEIYYTEEISLFEAAKFDQVETVGRGYSKEDGLPHNKSCLECNLYPRSEV